MSFQETFDRTGSSKIASSVLRCFPLGDIVSFYDTFDGRAYGGSSRRSAATPCSTVFSPVQRAFFPLAARFGLSR